MENLIEKIQQLGFIAEMDSDTLYIYDNNTGFDLSEFESEHFPIEGAELIEVEFCALNWGKYRAIFRFDSVQLSSFSSDLEGATIAICDQREGGSIVRFDNEAPPAVAQWMYDGFFWGAYYNEHGGITYEAVDGETITVE